MQWLVLFPRAQKCREHLVHVGLFCHMEISGRETDGDVLCRCASVPRAGTGGIFSDFSQSQGCRIPSTQIPPGGGWGGSSWPSGEDHEGCYPQDLQGSAWATSLFVESEAVAWGGADTTTFTSANAQASGKRRGGSGLATDKNHSQRDMAGM